MLRAGSVFSFTCAVVLLSSLYPQTRMEEARKRDQVAFYHTGPPVLSSAANMVAGKDVLQEGVTGAQGMLETLGGINPSGQTPAPTSFPEL